MSKNVIHIVSFVNSSRNEFCRWRGMQNFRSSCSLNRTEILFDCSLCYMRMVVTSLGVTHSFRVHTRVYARAYLSIMSFEKVAWGNAHWNISFAVNMKSAAAGDTCNFHFTRLFYLALISLIMRVAIRHWLNRNLWIKYLPHLYL